MADDAKTAPSAPPEAQPDPLEPFEDWAGDWEGLEITDPGGDVTIARCVEMLDEKLRTARSRLASGYIPKAPLEALAAGWEKTANETGPSIVYSESTLRVVRAELAAAASELRALLSRGTK